MFLIPIGLLWHNGESCEYAEPFKLGTPTTIGILFDGTIGTLTYYKDGIDLGVAFSNLGKITDQLYPIISSSTWRTQMTLGCTMWEFSSLQELCRTTILKHMNRDEGINELNLPRSLKRFVLEGLSQK